MGQIPLLQETTIPISVYQCRSVVQNFFLLRSEKIYLPIFAHLRDPLSTPSPLPHPLDLKLTFRLQHPIAGLSAIQTPTAALLPWL